MTLVCVSCDIGMCVMTYPIERHDLCVAIILCMSQVERKVAVGEGHSNTETSVKSIVREPYEVTVYHDRSVCGCVSYLSLSLSLSISVSLTIHIYIYIYAYKYIQVYMYTYTYIIEEDSKHSEPIVSS